MAIPESVSIRDLNGSFSMNKTLSDPTDDILKLQEIGWIMRKAINYSAITLNISQYEKDGKIHVDVEQITSGGLKNTEDRVLDNEVGEKNDMVFGKVKGWTKFIQNADIKDDHMRLGWDQGKLEKDKGEQIQAYVESVGLKGEQWTADQIWGFEVIDGLLRYVRHIIVSRGKTQYKIKTVYDWIDKKK